MRVPQHILDESFRRAGFTQEALHDALRIMCPDALKGYDAATTRRMRNEWTLDNPTRFCCYFVSEMIYWYCAPVDSRAMSLPVFYPDLRHSDLHRYVEYPDGQIVDTTCDQFDDYALLDYTQAKPRMFLQTGGVGPSRRATLLATLLHLPLNISRIKAGRFV